MCTCTCVHAGLRITGSHSIMIVVLQRVAGDGGVKEGGESVAAALDFFGDLTAEGDRKEGPVKGGKREGKSLLGKRKRKKGELLHLLLQVSSVCECNNISAISPIRVYYGKFTF